MRKGNGWRCGAHRLRHHQQLVVKHPHLLHQLARESAASRANLAVEWKGGEWEGLLVIGRGWQLVAAVHRATHLALPQARLQVLADDGEGVVLGKAEAVGPAAAVKGRLGPHDGDGCIAAGGEWGMRGEAGLGWVGL